MAEQLDATERIAQQVRVALEATDLAAFADLLDPDVHWGPPGDPSPPCQNRDQVLSWYRRGRQAGVRARVSETVVRGDRILVGLRVAGNSAAARPGGDAEQPDAAGGGGDAGRGGEAERGSGAGRGAGAERGSDAGRGAETERWQVLTVRGGRVVGIVGYEERSQAAADAGLQPPPGG